MFLRFAICTFSMLAGCASVSNAEPLPAVTSVEVQPQQAVPFGKARDQIFPTTNAHLHLMSPRGPAAIAAQIYPPPLQEITLPNELQVLLRRREAASGNPPVGDLFTQNAIIVELETGVWQRGHGKINRFLGFLWDDVDYVPKAYGIGSSTGYIAGTLKGIRGNKQETWNFLLGLEKSQKGKWQIAAETFHRIPPVAYSKPVDADLAIKQMDEAKVRYGVILAGGYWYADPEGMRFENDWNIAEAARYPGRLIPFCGVNPLLSFAVAEVERCSRIAAVRGIKVHFANAGVDLNDPEHARKVQEVFAAANREGLALVAHIRPIGKYGRVDVENFISKVLPSAPDVPIQVAHAASSAEALTVFAEQIELKNPAVRNVIFDWGDMPPDLMRRVGLDRFFVGTDMVSTSGDSILQNWKRVRNLSFTDDELRDIADNVPGYIR